VFKFQKNWFKQEVKYYGQSSINSLILIITIKNCRRTDNKESEKTKHAHMKMEINENATKTNTN
jgi:hypothetical protein